MVLKYTVYTSENNALVYDDYSCKNSRLHSVLNLAYLPKDEGKALITDQRFYVPETGSSIFRAMHVNLYNQESLYVC
jgi:hypothetical protein